MRSVEGLVCRVYTCDDERGREGGTEITWQYDFLSEPSSPFNPESPMGNSFVPGLPVRIL